MTPPGTKVYDRIAAGRGEPLLPDEPATLAELFFEAARKHRLNNALNFKRDGSWQQISSASMASRAAGIAFGLQSLGIAAGDRVAIFSSNRPEWTLADAGCQAAGIVDVPIYTTLAPSSIKYILNDCSARAIFIENSELHAHLAEILAECASLEHLIFFEPTAETIENSMTLADLESLGAAERGSEEHRFDELITASTHSDVATLIYTSGTTGEPKGVMLTHDNIISNVIDAGEKYDFSSADVPLSVLPLSHIFERSAMYLYIFNGMAVHYAESIDKVPDNLREVRPTIFVGVPRIFEKVYAKAKLTAARGGGWKERIFDRAIDIATRFAHDISKGLRPGLLLRLEHLLADKFVLGKLRAVFGGRLRFCITGGAALSNNIFLIFTGTGIPIMQGYGLTETSPVITSNNPQSVKLGTVGRPIRNMRVRIANDGEIEATGPGVMLGYFNKDSATEEAFTVDGWFRTGDIGEIDGDGFLKITDRKKELFKTSGGKYIAPSPIEQMIRSSRFVNQAVLVGNERKFAAALIVPNFEMVDSYLKHKGLKPMSHADCCVNEKILDLFERQVATVTKGLARYETVKKIALLENEFTVEGGELTPTMKLKRRVIDEKYKLVIEGLYADETRTA